MAERRVGLIMHGVTGRMGYNQHLVRSILAIREQGGVVLKTGDQLMPDPILVGRDREKIQRLAEKHHIARWTTDLDAALANPDDEIFFDAGTTQMRAALLGRAIDAGKHVYCEKPVSDDLESAIALAKKAKASGKKHGVVQDKLFLPGLLKLKLLKDSGFFGRMFAVRGEFGYWVFEGDWGQPAQRPSWNYRKADGGGIILDMLCHWRYVLDNLFGKVEAVSCLGATHIPSRVDERGNTYAADADDAAYATFQLEGGVVAHINSSWDVRVRRDDLVTFQVDGTHGSAVAGLHTCFTQHRVNTPKPVWNPDIPQTIDFFQNWEKVPDNNPAQNGFKAQWEMFLRHVAEDAPWRYGLEEGAKGVQLAMAGLQSWQERRWVDIKDLGDMIALNLPNADRTITAYRLSGTPIPFEKHAASDFPRIAYAAAHVVADPLASNDLWLAPAIDWDATLRFRHRLWDLGLGVAEAMDTAQRGMGLGWPEARELIARSLKEAAGRDDALIACGAGTDHLAPGPDVTINTIIAAYEEQVEAIESLGGRIILMASRALAAAAKSPDDYAKVYGRILGQTKEPVVLHWLGEMFDPALEGYWGQPTHEAAMDVCLDVIAAHADKVDGIKISLLSKEKEIAMRRRLPDGVRMYTGDDFNYAELIAGDDEGHSDALLGIFDAIAPAASAALAALGRGSDNEFFELLEPTVPLSRHIFAAPTRFYKTGVVFLAWLNGLQDHFSMVGGQQSARSVQHFAELFRLADKARVLSDPVLATTRMKQFLAVHGIA